MKKPNRISLSLLDDELKELINSSTKIFPITQEDVDENNNPNGYEYGRVGNSIYRWENGKWSCIETDGVASDVIWTNVKNKPSLFPPSEHTHKEKDITDLDTYSQSVIDSKLGDKADTVDLHTHDNLSVLSLITQEAIEEWEAGIDLKFEGKADAVDLHTHNNLSVLSLITQEAIEEWETALSGKAAAIHNHDGRYLPISLGTTISHLEARIIVLEASSGDTGGTGHSHTNYSVLDGITNSLISNWNNAYSHTNDEDAHLSEDDRLLLDSVEDKADADHTHDYADIEHNHDDEYYTQEIIDSKLEDIADTDYVDDAISTRAKVLHGHTKAQITDFPTKLSAFVNDLGYTKITVGPAKPSGGLWYEVITDDE